MKNEEVLFTWPERGFAKGVPVTLLSKDGVPYSLHCQTGAHHNEAIESARKLLSWRGLKVGKPILLGPTGLYYVVEAE